MSMSVLSRYFLDYLTFLQSQGLTSRTVWKTCGCRVKPQDSLNRELWNLALRGEEEKINYFKW